MTHRPCYGRTGCQRSRFSTDKSTGLLYGDVNFRHTKPPVIYSKEVIRESTNGCLADGLANSGSIII